MMKQSLFIFLAILLAGIMVAGCTQQNLAAPVVVPTPTAGVTNTVAATPVQQTTFSLGDHFLDKKYSWQNGNEVYTEQFVVEKNQPWGIKYDITPLNDDPKKCWYEVTITNMDTTHSESFGFGRTYGSEKIQMYPVYGSGPYQLELKGNYVKVDMIAAKRVP